MTQTFPVMKETLKILFGHDHSKIINFEK